MLYQLKLRWQKRRHFGSVQAVVGPEPAESLEVQRTYHAKAKAFGATIRPGLRYRKPKKIRFQTVFRQGASGLGELKPWIIQPQSLHLFVKCRAIDLKRVGGGGTVPMVLAKRSQNDFSLGCFQGVR